MTLSLPPGGLPVESALPALRAALTDPGLAVLVAPPGAGKTTRVPLDLLAAPWRGDGALLVLEPRRLAARAAAERMAATLGEAVGATVGVRVRMESRVSAATRIEVVTEGVFTRRILADPSLDGVAAVLFDEVHERSLEGDLGLALALDARAGLRPDLRLVAMSATLDGARFAAVMGGAPIVESHGRAFPVETRYRPRDPARRLEDETVAVVLEALAAEPGSLLVFLPGQGEIERVAERLTERLGGRAIDVAPLYGALDPRAQDRAIAPAPAGRRKIVLATAIAETSLTIEGVRVVIDGGLARVPRYDPETGLTRLVTTRVSLASADQRRGRAGRTEPGVCYRLWPEPETRALAPSARPELLEADPSGLALALADWGVADPAALAWLDPPPRGAFAEARTLLTDLGALDGSGRLTAHGRALGRLPLPPRLAHMLLAAGAQGRAGLAARIALLLTERGLGGRETDLRLRLEALARDRGPRARDGLSLARSWVRAAGLADGTVDPDEAGVVLAHAYPERLAQARPGRPGELRLANGKGALLEPTDALAAAPYLAVAELGGADPQRPRVGLAAPLTEAELRRVAGDRITQEERLDLDGPGAPRLRRLERLGALILSEVALGRPPPERVRALRLEALARAGVARLPWAGAATQLRARIAAAGTHLPGDWPDVSESGLADLAAWLGPYLGDGAPTPDRLAEALRSLLPWDLARRLDEALPTHLDLPTGNRAAIDWTAEGGPAVEVRLQELFGLRVHPTVANGRIPLVLRLLSPAHRPVQVTKDLPGFWAGSYAAVRSELRGRYPRHPWPDDPAAAEPTARAKRRS